MATNKDEFSFEYKPPQSEKDYQDDSNVDIRKYRPMELNLTIVLLDLQAELTKVSYYNVLTRDFILKEGGRYFNYFFNG